MFSHVRIPLRTARFGLLAAAFLAHSLSGQAPEAIQVIDVSPQGDGVSTANAVQAYNRGHIVRMVGASEADVIRMFGTKLGTFKVFRNSREAARSSAGSDEPLKLQAVAGYKDALGVVHTVQSFASEDSPNAKGKIKWREHLDDWVERESAKAAKVGDPSPPADAWTMLYTTSVQATSKYDNFAQTRISVYRLNGIDLTKDYYMVYTVPEVKPDFSKCDGFSVCGWHTISRKFGINAAGSELTDHGPTGTINSESASFAIGGSLKGGASAAFTASWSQADVEIVDGSSATEGAWKETFNNGINPCNPYAGEVPPASSGTFFSRQGAIFQVPGGTTKFNTSITTETSFCSYALVSVFNGWDALTIQTSLALGPPTFSVTPTSLTIPAGQSATLLVDAFIPGSTQGFAWNVSTNHATSWLTVPSNGPFSTGRAIQVNVAPNTPDGSVGTISVDSSPPFAAPSVETGPIEVQVTVGTPKTQNSTGVLVMGGSDISNSIAATPEVFDVTTRQSFPTGIPNFAPTGHTATLLSNGDILIAGGGINSAQIVTNAAQLFHPASRTFSPTGNMNSARRAHTATLLPNGKVLVIGGEDSGNNLTSAELYDPATGTFTPTGSMGKRRSGHKASLISDPGQPAQVVVYGSPGLPQAWELWSEASGGKFTAQGTMAASQSRFPQPLPLGNGRLALAGGVDDNGLSIGTEQLLGPNGPSFVPGQSMNVARWGHTLTALPGNFPGLFVAIGGYDIKGNPLGSLDVRASNDWYLLSGTAPCPGGTGCLITPRGRHTATVLPDGTIFVAGGADSNSAALRSTEVFNPSSKSFSSGPMMSSRVDHTATLFATSTTTLNVSPNPSIAGQTVTMAASVTALTGTPDGSVQFLDNSTVLQTVRLKDGQATFSTSALTAGQHSLTAVYSGNVIPAASQSQPVTLTVSNAETTTSLTSSPNPSSVGEGATFIATVRPMPDGGTITFKDGAATLGTVPVNNGGAQLNTATLSFGQHSITAAFSGSPKAGGSTSAPLIQNIQGVTTTKLQISPVSAVLGQAVTLAASVTSPAGTPTGDVNFAYGTTSLGTAPLVNGLAAIRRSDLTAGTYAIVATYVGNVSYRSSADSGSLTIQKAPTAIALRSSLNPSQVGQPVTFTATVSTNSSGTPSGTITLSDGRTVLGTPSLTGGVAAVIVSALSTGNHSITATYSGDANFATVTSSVLIQQVTGGLVTPTVELSVQPDRVTVGHQVSFKVKVSYPGGPVPSGSVTISDATNAANIYGIGVLQNGIATVQNTTIPVGSYNLVATYGGDGGAHYTGAQSNSAPLQVVVAQSSRN